MKKILTILCFLPLFIQAQSIIVTTSAGSRPTYPTIGVSDTLNSRVLINTGTATINGNVTIGGTLTVSGTITGSTFVHRYSVGTQGNFTTLKAAITWLSTGGNMTANSEILLDGGISPVTDSIGIYLPYTLSIRGMDEDISILQAATGLLNKPFFNIRSDVIFHAVKFDGSMLSTYGTHILESGINITKAVKLTVHDCCFMHLSRGINITNSTKVEIHGDHFTNCYRAIDVNSTGATFLCAQDVKIDTCSTGINLLKATNGNFYLNDIEFVNVAADTAINYNGTTFTYSNHPAIGNCKFNVLGVFFNGFDFTRTDGRDANIYIRNNEGSEDKSPHLKINVVSSADTTRIGTANIWHKINYTITSVTEKCKIKVTTVGKINTYTYQPTNLNSLWIYVSGGYTLANTNRTLKIALVKNGNSAVRYGESTIRFDATSGNVQLLPALFVYLEDLAFNDYFELYITSANANDIITVSDLQIAVRTQ